MLGGGARAALAAACRPPALAWQGSGTRGWSHPRKQGHWIQRMRVSGQSQSGGFFGVSRSQHSAKQPEAGIHAADLGTSADALRRVLGIRHLKCRALKVSQCARR